MNNKFNYIINPETGRNVSIHTTLGKKIIHNYIKTQQGGTRVPLYAEPTSKEKQQPPELSLSPAGEGFKPTSPKQQFKPRGYTSVPVIRDNKRNWLSK